MRYNVLTAALIGICVLCMMGCGTQRSVKSAVSSRVLLEASDTLREQVMVAVHDTLREVTTISVQMNEAGDTVFKSMVTERDRLRFQSDVRNKQEETRVVIDSIYTERNDSVKTNTRFTASGESRSSSLVTVLKWVVAMMVVLSMLIVIVRIKV